MNRNEQTGQIHIKESTKTPIYINQQIYVYNIEKTASEQKTKMDIITVINLLISAGNKIKNLFKKGN